MKANFTSQLEQFDGNLWGRHIKVSIEIVQPFLLAQKKRVLCSVKGSSPIHCALLSLGNGEWFINLNKAFCNENNLRLGEKVKIEIEIDRSKYGMEMPEELEVMLNQDGPASTYFEALTPGKQRGLIHFVASIKSSDIRIRRAVVVAKHLTSHSGKIDYKDLNQEIKEANNLGKF